MVTTVVRGTAQVKQLAGEMTVLQSVAITTGVAMAGLAAAFALRGIGEAIKKSMQLSDELQALKAATFATEEEFKKMSDLGFELGESMGAFTTPEAVEAMRILAYAGYDVNEILTATPQILKLSSAGMVDLAEATDITASTVRSFGMDVSETTRVVDVLTKTFISTNTMMGDLGEAMKYVAPVAAAAGMELEDVATSLGIMANAGIKSSMAGTTLRAVLIRLQAPTTEARRALNELGVEIFEMGPLAQELSRRLSEQTDELHDLEIQMNATKTASSELALELDKLSLQESKNTLEIMKIRDKAADQNRELSEQELAYIARLEAANDDLAISQKELSIQQQELDIQAQQQKTSYDALNDVIKDLNKQLNGEKGELKDMESILIEFNKAMEDMSASERAVALNAIVGRRAIAGFQVLLNSVGDQADVTGNEMLQMSAALEELGVAEDDVASATSDGVMTFGELKKMLDEAGGTADEVFAIMEEGSGKQWKQFTSAVDTLMIKLGDELAPILMDFVSAIKDDLGPALTLITGFLAPLLPVLKLLGWSITVLLEVTGKYEKEAKALAIVLGVVLLTPLMLLIVQLSVFILIIAGVIWVIGHLVDWVKILASFIGDKLSPVIDYAKKQFDELAYAVSIVINFFKYLDEKLSVSENIIGTFVLGIGLMGEAFEWVKELATSFGEAIEKFVTNRIEDLTEYVDMFKEKLESLKEILIDAEDKFKDMIPLSVIKALEKVSDFIENIVNKGKDLIGVFKNIPGIGVGGSEGTVGDIAKGIWPFAEGGIVTQPTVALIGEKGAEAVVPLNKSYGSIPNMGSSYVSNDTYVFNPTIEGDMGNDRVQQLYDMFVQKIEDHKRNKSKNAFAEVSG